MLCRAGHALPVRAALCGVGHALPVCATFCRCAPRRCRCAPRSAGVRATFCGCRPSSEGAGHVLPVRATFCVCRPRSARDAQPRGPARQPPPGPPPAGMLGHGRYASESGSPAATRAPLRPRGAAADCHSSRPRPRSAATKVAGAARSGEPADCGEALPRGSTPDRHPSRLGRGARPHPLLGRTVVTTRHPSRPRRGARQCLLRGRTTATTRYASRAQAAKRGHARYASEPRRPTATRVSTARES